MFHHSKLEAQSPTIGKGPESSDRPPIRVEPGGIGPVTELNQNDVLCGRGGRINGHYGNIQFRKFCSEKRAEYLGKGTKKIEKAHIAAAIVERIRSLDPPGRFLRQESDEWYDIGCAKAMTKVGQAIREQSSRAGQNEDTAKPSCTSSDAKAIPTLSEPLYPGYKPLEMDQEDHKPTAVSSSNNEGVLNPLCPSLAFHPEKRISTLASSRSGPTRMSTTSLMRASVQSELSDGMSLAPSSSGGLFVVRRQSIFSDISDCMSLMSLGDDYCQPDATNSDETATRATTACNVFRDSHCKPPCVQSTINGQSLSTGRRYQQRQAKRRSSIWSMSIGSAISFGSIGSGTSLSLS